MIRAYLLGLLLAVGSIGGSALAQGTFRFRHLSLEAGLSQVQVTDVLQDRKGFMWFGTKDGLNRYDGYEFTVYKHDPENPATLSDNYVEVLCEDRNGLLWIGTRDSGLSVFDPKRGVFRNFRHQEGADNGLSNGGVLALVEDDQGNLWIGTQRGLNRYLPESGVFQSFFHDPADPSGLVDDRINRLLIDKRNTLWIGTSKGLVFLEPGSEKFQFFDVTREGFPEKYITALFQSESGVIWVGGGQGLLSFDPHSDQPLRSVRFHSLEESSSRFTQINTIFENRERIWVGSQEKGLYIFEPGKEEVLNILPNPMDPKSLSYHSIARIYEDRTGLLWIATSGAGLDIYNPDLPFFYHGLRADGTGLKSEIIYAVQRDATSALWVGTDGGGVNVRDPRTGVFRRHDHNPEDPYSKLNRITTLLPGVGGSMWVGTTGGLFSMNIETADYSVYRNRPGDPSSLNHDYVSSLYQPEEPHAREFWVGTDGGLNLLDLETGRFRRPSADVNDPEKIFGGTVRVIQKKHGDQALWLATEPNGLYLVDMEANPIAHYRHDFRDPNSLSNNRVTCLCPDPRQPERFLWVGTRGGGFNLLDMAGGHFRQFRTRDGLPNDTVYGILDDKRGYLWLSTNKGLSRFDPSSETFENFDQYDGLQGDEFNTGAYFKDADGTLYFGGMEGLTVFNPAEIQTRTAPPDIIVSRFLRFNREVLPRTLDATSPLKEAIHDTNTIELSYRDSVFSFELSLMDYANPSKNRYAYKMDGFDDAWLFTKPGKRTATYTNLDPGTYTFRARSAGHEGSGDHIEAVIDVIIEPPIWQTWWAYLVYLTAVILLVYAYIRANRLKLEQERRVVQRLSHLDAMKDEFLANTSHELRTPLNGIIGLTESLLSGAGGELSASAKQDLSFVASCGKRLTGLINDILDFSKLKNQTLELNLEAVDVREVVESVLSLCRSLVDRKPLELVSRIPEGLSEACADENRLQQIMFNLIGNAVKFTERGSVEITAEADETWLTVRVRDTGIGIPEHQYEHIFQSFQQGRGTTTRSHGGTGIGLAVSRQLVELHGGRIWVDSEVGVGSTFSFTLPLWDREAEPAPRKEPVESLQVAALETAIDAEPVMDPVPSIKCDSEQEQVRILVVDDDQVNRRVLRNHLTMENYRVLEAADGQEALDLFREERTVDLVLLDIMMPGISGYEVCRQLRKDYTLRELPLIFLTAKGRSKDLIMGFEHGGNDYLVKPIDRSELIARVKTHLELLHMNRDLEALVQDRTSHLIKAQKDLLAAAHQAGMAEIATHLLHNVGNSFNSFQTAAQILHETVNRQEWRRRLVQWVEVAGKVDEERGTGFFEGERGRMLLNSMQKITAACEKHARRMAGESQGLQEALFGMTDILRQHRRYTSLTSHTEKTDLNELVRETFRMQDFNLKSADIAVVEDLQPLPELTLEKAKVRLTLLCLLENAYEAIGRLPQAKGRVTARTRKTEDGIMFELRDDGPGIAEEHRDKVFRQGFTTKPDGSGLGLHFAVTTMREAGGSIQVDTSEAVGVGIQLHFPLMVNSSLEPHLSLLSGPAEN
ncbi:MAG: ATP-binding protein [Acidobacteriota bacterium]|nr:ATP-binding protein [Acidobacteriota bacterium]